MNILTNDFVKPEGQRELARFGLAKNRTFKNDFVKPEGQRELAHFGLVRTDDKPRGEAEFTQTIPRREGRRRKSTSRMLTDNFLTRHACSSTDYRKYCNQSKN